MNRMSSRVLEYKTLLQVLQNNFPISRITNDLLKMFYIHILYTFRSKLDPKAKNCIFLYMLPIKRVTNVLIQLPRNSMKVRMTILLIFTFQLLKGKVHEHALNTPCPITCHMPSYQTLTRLFVLDL